MRPHTILVADDHTIVREGLATLLREHHFDVVASVGDGRALLDAARRHRPDVIVTDISMPGLNGLDALRQLTAEHTATRVVVLTMHNDAELAARALKAGASGFLLKESAGEELVDAIGHALNGHVYLTPALTLGVMALMTRPAGEAGPVLTSRQLQVVRLVALGKRVKEIGVLLDLSPRTIETHKYEAMAQLGLTSTADLVRYVVEHGLMEA